MGIIYLILQKRPYAPWPAKEKEKKNPVYEDNTEVNHQAKTVAAKLLCSPADHAKKTHKKGHQTVHQWI